MFVSHDKNVNKKKFQKPNILRRKSKIPSVKLTITTGSCESPQAKSLLAPITTSESKIASDEEEKIDNYKSCKLIQNEKKFSQKTNLEDFTSYEVQVNAIERNNIEVNKNTLQSIGTVTLYGATDENDDQSTLNFESFLVSSPAEENITLLENEMFEPKITDIQGNQKWCFDLINNTPKLILEECDDTSQLDSVYLDQKSNIITSMVPLTAVSSVQSENSYIVPAEQIVDELTIQKLSEDDFFPRSYKYKCEVPECNKEFMSEQKLKKHMNVHNKDGRTRVSRQTTTECPVIKIKEDGREHPCGRVFQIRRELMKHLNEEHKPEDAMYRCDECGRRFFWASGLRAHGRAHGSRRPRATLACPWPGCSRVFRQPCRLREHSRAHTGDKPYPCRYPNCGWSFRTASKLVRHSYRHTGERRHSCAACGRAFLRREHLRDHMRRHARRACTHNGCDQTFTKASALYMHLKKVHRKEDQEEEDLASGNTISIEDMVTFDAESPETDITNKIDEEEPVSSELSLNVCGPEVDGVVCEDEVEDEAGEVEDVGVEGEILLGEEHAARTHCTWPLSPRAHAFEQPDDYVLEEDTQVEHSEISESNIYTVRSDLFLHGNVLTNEDSQHMAGGGEGGTLDAELLLAPSVDIAQEELYTDAVDESAFRVFLLSGEDLA